MSTSTMRAVAGSIRRNSVFNVERTSTASAAESSNTSWAGANQDKGQKILVPSRIFFCFRLFKRLQHLIADVKRVRQSF